MKSQSEDDSKTQKIALLCPTRWTVRAKSLNSIITNYSFLQDLWQRSLENCTDTEMKARIRGVETYMNNFDFVYGVLLGELVLGHSDNLSRTLQDPKLSAVQAQDRANKTVETMISIRNNEKYDLFSDLVNKKASNLGAYSPTISRKKRDPARLNEYFGYGPAEPSSSSSLKDISRNHYFEALDLAINSIKQRFNQKNYAKYANSQELLLKAAKTVNFDGEFNSVIEFNKSDFDSMVLKTQLVTLGSIIPNGIRTFDEIVGYLKASNSGVKSLISEVIKLTKRVLVYLATSATSERAFSALRRVKNYLQSTMNRIRVNNIIVLHVRKERTDNLDLIEIAREFVIGSENRLLIFGSFKKNPFFILIYLF